MSADTTAFPVVRGVALILAHVPSLVRLGSKPMRELRSLEDALARLGPRLRAGSGNVPLTNYRTLAGLAVLEGVIPRDGMDAFVRSRGLPGSSPTQGHIASAIPYLGHAVRGLSDRALRRVMLSGKGSLFLGRMTQLADGLSLVLERNPALG